MDRALLVITNPLGSQESRRALAIARTLNGQGRGIALALLQDAVPAAVKRDQTPAAQSVSELLAQGVAVHVAQQDLVLRGISTDDLTPGATAVDDRRLVDLMLADGIKTLGCF